jgi:hypothetical protein
MTHKELCGSASKWLRTHGYKVILEEEMSVAEIPDSIGFRISYENGVTSALIECKTSRSDFFADKKKFFRKNPEKGMGTFRYFLCEPDIIKKEDLPDKWGLIYVKDNKARIVCGYSKRTNKEDWEFSKNNEAETLLLYCVLRRKEFK